MKYIILILTFLSLNTIVAVNKSAHSETNQKNKFIENKTLWESIDNTNNKITSYKKYIPQRLLKTLFSKTIEILKTSHLDDEFEKLRNEAFNTDDFNKIDQYIKRSKPILIISIMGESNNIGINVNYFIKKCNPKYIDYKFFRLVSDGFYIKIGNYYRIGTSKFPIWIKRTESSFQGKLKIKVVKIYLNKWKILHPKLKGIYKSIAFDTIERLNYIIKKAKNI